MRHLFGGLKNNYYLCISERNNINPKSRKGTNTMKANEIRLVNVKQDQCKVYFHLDNGKTVVRTMEAGEIIAANRLRRTKGEDARIAEYARLFNEKYSEPQETMNVELNNSERRFFELHHMRSIGILTPGEGEEYQRLLNE